MDEQIKIHGKEHKAEAVRETFRICKDRSILKEFIESHEKEAVDIMVQLYGQREAVENYGRSQYVEGEMKKAKETALNLHEMNMPVEQIAKAVKVSIAQVNEWLGLALA